MIKFPEDIYFSKTMEFKIGKDRIKLLERALRRLGNFSKQEDIKVIDFEYVGVSDSIYEIKDNDNTSFKFLSYGLGNDNEPNRYRKNFYLIMKKENSNFTYTYYMSQNYYKENELRVIELGYSLDENRIIKLERIRYLANRIIIEEQDRKYKISFGRQFNEKYEEELLKNFETIIEKAKLIEKLNLENILKIFDDIKEITSCCIYEKEEMIASVILDDGNILNYEINEPSKNIKVTLGNEITRTVERTFDNDKIKDTIEIKEDNYEKIKSDYKRLFKKL